MELKYYNVVIDARNFFDQAIKSDLFDQPIKNGLKTCNNIRKIATGPGDDYTTGYLLDYPYFKKYYKLITIDLNEQQKLDAGPKSIQQKVLLGI